MEPAQCLRVGPNSANSLIPSLIAWTKSQPPGNVAIVSEKEVIYLYPGSERPATACICKPAGCRIISLLRSAKRDRSDIAKSGDFCACPYCQ